jgi:hypothetical protein
MSLVKISRQEWDAFWDDVFGNDTGWCIDDEDYQDNSKSPLVELVSGLEASLMQMNDEPWRAGPGFEGVIKSDVDYAKILPALKKWRERQSSAFLTIQVPKSKEAELRMLVAEVGGKVC